MSIEINGDNFEREVKGASQPVVADFWAPWCGYCRRLSPVVDRLEKEYGERIRFVKINIDDNAGLAEQYEVDTIPTLILFRDGDKKASVVNPSSQAAIESWFNENGAI